MTATARVLETVSLHNRPPVVEAGVLWNVDDLVAAWVCDRLKAAMPQVEYRAFGIVKPGTPDGEIKDLASIYLAGGVIWYNHCNGEGGHEHDIAAAVALDDHVFQRRDSIRKLLEYPFSFLKVPRITVTINETNEHAIKQAERMGFKIEGLKRRAGSRGTDMVLLGLLPGECPFWTQG